MMQHIHQPTLRILVQHLAGSKKRVHHCLLWHTHLHDPYSNPFISSCLSNEASSPALTNPSPKPTPCLFFAYRHFGELRLDAWLFLALYHNSTFKFMVQRYETLTRRTIRLSSNIYNIFTNYTEFPLYIFFQKRTNEVL